MAFIAATQQTIECACWCETRSLTGSASTASIRLYFLLIFSSSKSFLRQEQKHLCEGKLQELSPSEVQCLHATSLSPEGL